MQQPDLAKMMRDAAKMQAEIARIQNELQTTPVEGSAGGGAVKITCTGALDFSKVKISKEAVDPDDVETLEDLVLMAIKDACDKARDLGQQKMDKTMGSMGLPPGLGL
ncbi:MAG TPA: YbaB/EbfC family nucleoid-associated protein [Chroococcales cyanobacterium]